MRELADPEWRPIGLKSHIDVTHSVDPYKFVSMTTRTEILK
ncbi:hypothetical protein BN2475_670014 [Paraburkholderia ribeironis]|uniref:Uncharacterized protein n=1 Tax=Paraburkholderia ribeironis TaxID=1247936 RepID=A0A1N7SGM2_9BURK|nr:hypothetical protein BN2475_670014 [Paraburkholderia ribeironis]